MKPGIVDAIKARLAAATPGEWWHDPRKCYRPGSNGAAAISWGSESEAVFVGRHHTIAITGPGDDPQSMADAALIAHAPTDLAALVAEVERLRAVVAEQAAAFEAYYEAIDYAGRMYHDVTDWPMDDDVQGPIDAAEQRFRRAGGEGT